MCLCILFNTNFTSAMARWPDGSTITTKIRSGRFKIWSKRIFYLYSQIKNKSIEASESDFILDAMRLDDVENESFEVDTVVNNARNQVGFYSVSCGPSAAPTGTGTYRHRPALTIFLEVFG